MRYDDDLNLYAYVRNDPLNGVDPTGTELLFMGDFKLKAQFAEDLEIIGSQPEGAQLIRDIISSDQLMVVMRSGGIEPRNQTIFTDRASEANASNGEGTGVAVALNPDQTRGYLDVTGSSERPRYVGTAHELGHGRAAMYGEEDPSNPEMSAAETENAVRKEQNLPLLDMSQF